MKFFNKRDYSRCLNKSGKDNTSYRECEYKGLE